MEYRDDPHQVIRFYNNHPINYREIIQKIKESHIPLESLTENELSKFDQDHYDGSHAIDVLIDELEISEQLRVLDLCCGIGGTTRYLADKCGCRVTGADLTGTRIEAAAKLSELTRLTDRTEYVTANACEMPFREHSFHIMISQEAFLSIPDKRILFNETRRVLKEGGKIGFTDITALRKVDYQENPSYYEQWNVYDLPTEAQYVKVLENCGFNIIKTKDLSSLWKRILKVRYEMYLSLKEDTEKLFGEEAQKKWDANYKYFVDQYQKNVFGGIRIIAQKNS
jgi:sarcosine/dimethylglycine N-methyltransferase